MNWHVPKEAVPRHAVQMIPVDRNGNVLVMHRSNNVRSAKNVWSFPSGLHEIGQSIDETIIRELAEEYDLTPYRARLLGVYENIAGDSRANDTKQYHWVISVYAVLIDDVNKAVNKEPDKHDQMKFVRYSDLGSPDFYNQHNFHLSFSTWALRHLNPIVEKLADVVSRHQSWMKQGA